MKQLLPELQEIVPISGNRNTFGESKNPRNFETLNFQTKLQIINDIVRQTMLVEEFPDPKTEVEKMTGDSYTASVIAIEYLKKLEIGTNYKLMLAKKKPYELNNMNTTNFFVLIEDNNGKYYQFDCSPFVGYPYGKVQDIEKEYLYKEYYEIKGEAKKLLNALRQILFELHHNVYINAKREKEILWIVEMSKKFEFLKVYYSKIQSFFQGKQKNNISMENKNGGLPLMQIKLWEEELKSLITQNINIERQIELSQWINQEYSKQDSKLQKFAIIGDEKLPFSSLTPRYFYEKKLNCVIIKPSAYWIGQNDTIRTKMLEKDSDDCILGEFETILGGKSKDGIRIMNIFHPDGYKYERSMYGPCNIFLIHESADILQIRKKKIRKTLSEKMAGTTTTWFDGKLFYWDPIIANFVHSTDNSCEVACHYVSPFPEYQLMTRYMYPNPRLKF